MNFILFALPVLLVLAVSHQVAARAWNGLPLVSALVAGFAVLEVGSLLPGAIGCYAPWPVALTTSALATAILLVLRRYSAAATLAPVPAMRLPWPSWLALLAMVGLMETRPLVKHLLLAPVVLFQPEYYLDYDVVYYHLPALADFLQQQTLWRTTLPYQNYFYAHELIAGYAAVFFHSHWGFFVSHFLALVLLIASLAAIARHLLPRDPASDLASPIAVTAVTLLALALWVRAINTDIFRIGKNDHFVAACALAAFALLLEYRAQRSRGLLVLAAAAAGLAIGTKPTALVFFPVWCALALLPWPRRSWSVLVPFLLVIVLLGGFWPLRNTILDGSPIPAGRADGFARTVWQNIDNPKLWQRHPDAVVFGLALLAVPLAGLQAWRRRSQAWGWLAAFSASAALGALFTPFLFFDLETGRGWQLRLVHVCLLSGALAYAASLAFLGRTVVQRSSGANFAKLPGRLAFAGLAAALLVMPVAWSGHEMEGSKVWAASEHGGRAGAYAFVQRLPAPVRIASWGAAPAWLLGPDWQHTVFAHYTSVHLDGNDPGRREVLHVLRDFRPDYLVVMAEPAYGPAIPRGLPPLTAWLNSRAWLERVFVDDFSAVFAIRPGWEEAVRSANLDPFPIRVVN